jgi:hypothetical protein
LLPFQATRVFHLSFRAAENNRPEGPELYQAIFNFFKRPYLYPKLNMHVAVRQQIIGFLISGCLFLKLIRPFLPARHSGHDHHVPLQIAPGHLHPQALATGLYVQKSVRLISHR